MTNLARNEFIQLTGPESQSVREATVGAQTDLSMEVGAGADAEAVEGAAHQLALPPALQNWEPPA